MLFPQNKSNLRFCLKRVTHFHTHTKQVTELLFPVSWLLV